MSDNCLFCKMVRGDINPDKVFEDDQLLAFRDNNPQAPTHVLIIPKRHIATLNDIRTDDTGLVGRMFIAAAKIARDEGTAEAGYRTVFNCNAAAGQTVFHIHLHLLGGRNLSWPPG
jgi:histidine triad (HIT) family protein